MQGNDFYRCRFLNKTRFMTKLYFSQATPLIDSAYAKVKAHQLGDGLQAQDLNAFMKKTMNLVLDWSALGVEAACHMTEDKKFKTIMPAKIVKQVQDDFITQVKKAVDLLSYAGINLMRLRVFDAVAPDIGDKIKERLDSVFSHAAQKWDSVDVKVIEGFKHSFNNSIQGLLKE